MTRMKRMTLIGGAAALVLAATAGAFAVDPGPRQDGYKPGLQRIELQRRRDDAACLRLKDGARDLCKVQAEGREKVARAQLEAQRKPGPDSEQAVKEAQAEADYRVARQRCAGGPGKDACIARAKDARAAAVRLAMVEKVRHANELRAHAENQRKGKTAQPETPKARYAARKAYCEMQGPDRDRCLAAAKQQFNHS